jgi:16S rRNA (adenine1518-N6/adenine1519-N6)-dimethyltransferase
VIKFTPFTQPKVSCRNYTLLRQVIQLAFARRRKMLKNNLLSLHLSEKAVNELFDELNFDPHLRAENLSLEQYARLTDALENVTEKTI